MSKWDSIKATLVASKFPEALNSLFFLKNLFIYGCAGPSVQCVSFYVAVASLVAGMGSRHGDFSSCSMGLSNCSAQT